MGDSAGTGAQSCRLQSPGSYIGNLTSLKGAVTDGGPATWIHPGVPAKALLLSHPVAPGLSSFPSPSPQNHLESPGVAGVRSLPSAPCRQKALVWAQAAPAAAPPFPRGWQGAPALHGHGKHGTANMPSPGQPAARQVLLEHYRTSPSRDEFSAAPSLGH